MNIKIVSKDLEATEAIKDYIAKKMERVEKYFGDTELNVNVTIRIERENQVADIYFSERGRTFKASSDEKDLYASIDKDIDVLERQIRKEKARKESARRDETIKQISFDNQDEAQMVEEEVVKITHYDVRPISIEDAEAKLKENNMLFLPFVNVDTGKVNVLYKKDGNYGLVEPNE